VLEPVVGATLVVTPVTVLVDPVKWPVLVVERTVALPVELEVPELRMTAVLPVVPGEWGLVGGSSFNLILKERCLP